MAITISDQILDDLFGSDGILKELSIRLMERVLEAEMTHHLGYEKHTSDGKNTGNSRNGKTTKTVKTGNGDITVTVPGDRTATFEPMLVGKLLNVNYLAGHP